MRLREHPVFTMGIEAQAQLFRYKPKPGFKLGLGAYLDTRKSVATGSDLDRDDHDQKLGTGQDSPFSLRTHIDGCAKKEGRKEGRNRPATSMHRHGRCSSGAIAQRIVIPARAHLFCNIWTHTKVRDSLLCMGMH